MCVFTGVQPPAVSIIDTTGLSGGVPAGSPTGCREISREAAVSHGISHRISLDVADPTGIHAINYRGNPSSESMKSRGMCWS